MTSTLVVTVRQPARTVRTHFRDGHLVRTTDAAGAAPLYVSRRLLNAAPLVAWARAAGLGAVLTPDALHVTVAYSRAPVDWFAVPSDYGDGLRVPAGGPRRMETFGGAGKPQVVVLRFASTRLQERWAALRAAGCSWDYPEYAPHVTVAGEPGRADVARLAPYQGPLDFGPEEFAPLD